MHRNDERRRIEAEISDKVKYLTCVHFATHSPKDHCLPFLRSAGGTCCNMVYNSAPFILTKQAWGPKIVGGLHGVKHNIAYGDWG